LKAIHNQTGNIPNGDMSWEPKSKFN
jgi:hypothetical protein